MYLVIRDKNGEIGRISEEKGTIVGDTAFAVKLAKSYTDDIDFCRNPACTNMGKGRTAPLNPLL